MSTFILNQISRLAPKIHNRVRSPWKQAILENCDEEDIQTIELGMQDADDQCRELAYSKFNPVRYVARMMATILLQPSDRVQAMQVPEMVNERLQAVLLSEDKAALSGLAANRSLTVGYLRKVGARLQELGDDIGVWSARKTIEEVQKTQVPEAPEEADSEVEVTLGQRSGSMLDLRHQRIRFAVSLITIIEHAQYRFETLIEGSKPRFIADNGSKAFGTDIELVEGLGKGSVWLDPDGRARFSCEIVENNPSLELVRSHLDIIVRKIVAYLSRDWEITEDPLSEPYLPRLRAVHKHWKLEIEAHIIPRVDNTFDTSLNIQAFR